MWYYCRRPGTWKVLFYTCSFELQHYFKPKTNEQQLKELVMIVASVYLLKYVNWFYFRYCFRNHLLCLDKNIIYGKPTFFTNTQQNSPQTCNDMSVSHMRCHALHKYVLLYIISSIYYSFICYGVSLFSIEPNNRSLYARSTTFTTSATYIRPEGEKQN